ncbi:MAG TPA: hypothetical protein DC042_01325 [Bacteroidales bacterium]|nr:hypothetical protein [Bacteroidales bacterium]
MSLKTATILACFLILLLPSCNNNKPSASTEPEVIRIDPDAKGSKLLPIELKAIVPLETKPECQWSYVADFQYYNDRVYILNNDRSNNPTLFLFEKSGKFIKKTRIGNGPGEVVSPYAFAIDPEDSSVLLYDMMLSAFHVFSQDLVYNRTVKMPRVYTSDFYPLGKDSFLVYHQIFIEENAGVRKYVTYSVYSDNFQVEKHLDVFLYGKQPGYGMTCPFSMCGSDLYFVSPLNYTIYHYQNGQALPAFLIDFGNAAISQQELESKISEAEMYPLFGGDKIFLVSGIYLTNDYLGVHTYYKKKPATFFQYRKTKAVYPLADCVEAGLVPDCRIYGVTEDETFYALAEPKAMIKYQEKTGKMKDVVITENDNPFVILFKIEGK